MKKMLVLQLILILLTGCGKTDKAAGYQQIDMSTAIEIMAKEEGYVILDVRTQAEYEEKHIPGAICIPNETIGTQRPSQLPDLDQRILVYCRSGNRSKQAAQKLSDMGYTNVLEFGGIIDWPGEIKTGNTP